MENKTPGLAEPLTFTGRVHMQLFDEHGNMKQEHYGDNLVVTTGKAFAASALIATTAITFGYMAVGTNATAAALSDTTLGTETARVAAAMSNPTSVTAQFVATFGAGVATGTIQEIGLFSAASNGTMFSHYLTGAYVKNALDTLAITWVITVS